MIKNYIIYILSIFIAFWTGVFLRHIGFVQIPESYDAKRRLSYVDYYKMSNSRPKYYSTRRKEEETCDEPETAK